MVGKHHVSAPVGFRFVPSDEELILCYLLNKVRNNKPLPPDLVRECDLYGDEKVWQKMFDETRETTLYFFTTIKKKNEKGKRSTRVALSGTWKGQTRDHNITAKTRQGRVGIIGYKKSFTYMPKNKNRSDDECGWTMYEYRLGGSLLPAAVKVDDIVLCKIIKQTAKGDGGEVNDNSIDMNNINSINMAAVTDDITSMQTYDSADINLTATPHDSTSYEYLVQQQQLPQEFAMASEFQKQTSDFVVQDDSALTLMEPAGFQWQMEGAEPMFVDGQLYLDFQEIFTQVDSWMGNQDMLPVATNNRPY